MINPFEIFSGKAQKTKLPQLNELTNPNKWDDAEWMEIHNELESYSVDKHCFSQNKEYAYRKGWEWTQCLYGLSKLGMLREDAKALGVGAGHEPILYYLTDRIAKVIGTDLYGNDEWAGNDSGGNEADKEVLQKPEVFCSRSYDESKLRFIYMDGTNLDFDDNSFDFVWSLSSIEHFGGHEAARKSVEEMARVTKKGGIVAVATEYIITPNYERDHEFFTEAMFEKYIIKATSLLKPIQKMDYTLPSLEYLIDPIMVHLDSDVDRIRHHIVLNNGDIQWTSVICFFRKVS